MSGGPQRAGFLAGVRVLELGDGVAGAAATSVLWALGADVTTVIDTSSAHRRGRPWVDVGGRRTSLLAAVLDRGKQFAGADDVEPGTYEVVVVDRVGGCRGALAALHDVDAYVSFVEQHSRVGWVTISAFGLSDTRAEDVASELTIAAASGMLASVRDPSKGQPLKLAGQQSLLNTGQAGALAACHALDLAASDGPVHLDLSATEATIALGPVLDAGAFLLDTGAPGGAKRYGAPASFYECADGMVRISAMEDHQWQGVVAAMESPSWAEQFATVQARIDGAVELDQRLEEWTRTLPKAEAEELLQARGVPATAVYAPVEILDSPQLAHRDVFESLPLDEGRSATVIGLPFRVVDSGTGSAKRRSLRGLRMLEASHVLAAPLGGAILGALGVEVTKLEDLRRLDMYRRRGPYIDGDAGMERSAYFALVNHSKRSAAFDVDADRARLAALVAECDVVLENLGQKRASTLGLAASTLVRDHRDVLAVSSSGFGQDGPRAAYRAYAYNMHASCALGDLTRTEDGELAELDLAWADLICAYSLATIIAAWAVGPRGNDGAGLDFAMADQVVAHFNEFVAAASLDPDSEAFFDRVNDLAPYAPHGVYRCAEGWIALAVDDDESYLRLAKVLGTEALTDAPFASAAGRLERRQALDALVSGATSDRNAGELAAELRAAGVLAEEVVSVAGLLTCPQLVARGFFTEVDHPVWGRRRLVGIPWRVFGGSPIPLGAPPLLEPIEQKED